MAKFKFAARLYESSEIIQANFRAHQSTILQLSARYKVGQETMRQFLMLMLGDEYKEIVQELREMLKLNNRQSIVKYGLKHKPGSCEESDLLRTKKDFSEEELKEFKRNIEARSVNPVVIYHPYIIPVLVSDDAW